MLLLVAYCVIWDRFFLRTRGWGELVLEGWGLNMIGKFWLSKSCQAKQSVFVLWDQKFMVTVSVMYYHFRLHIKKKHKKKKKWSNTIKFASFQSFYYPQLFVCKLKISQMFCELNGVIFQCFEYTDVWRLPFGVLYDHLKLHTHTHKQR